MALTALGGTVDPTYAARVGERLRAIRLQKGLSLHEVEQQSSKEFKASVLGAYERGERSISVPRLQRLARFYGVPADRLLPEPEGQVIRLDGANPLDGGVRIDLARLESSETQEAAIVGRYVNAIQMVRGDFNGKVITVRSDDVRALAAVMDTTPEAFASRLDDIGLRSQVP
jgi:transcriptional regulator with XRE-family HTH domain